MDRYSPPSHTLRTRAAPRRLHTASMDRCGSTKHGQPPACHDTEERGDDMRRARPEQPHHLAAIQTPQRAREAVNPLAQPGVRHETEVAEKRRPSGPRMTGQTLAQQMTQ